MGGGLGGNSRCEHLQWGVCVWGVVCHIYLSKVLGDRQALLQTI